MTGTTNPKELVVLRMPAAAAMELLKATEFVSWENDDFQTGVQTLEDGLSAPSSEVEAFLLSGRDLQEAGYGKSQLYELLRNSLTPSKHELAAQDRTIRDMKILRDLLRGEPIKVLADRYQLPSLAKSDAVAMGLRRLRQERDFKFTIEEHQALRKQCEGSEGITRRVLAELESALAEQESPSEQPEKIVLDVVIDSLVDDSEHHEDDLDVPDVVPVSVDASTPEHLLADAALDVLHATVAIKCLDDFEITVMRNGVPLATSDKHEAYSLANAGDVVERVETVKRNPLAEKFLDVFQDADAIEINGFFVRYYDETIHSGSGAPDETVIELSVETEHGMLELNVTEQDLDEIEIDDEGNTWRVAGCNVEFHSVSQISTNPVVEA